LRRYTLVLALLLGLGAEQSRSQQADTLVGLTWSRSELVSFDPHTGTRIEKHLQLNPYEAFRGLAYDARRQRLYALAQSSQNLYIIDVNSMETMHVGNLRIDRRVPGSVDAGSLAYDPFTDKLYVAIEHWEGSYTHIWSELCIVDPQTASLKTIARMDGPFIDSLAFNKSDRQLYGLAIYGSGPWDSPFKADLVRIDQGTGYIQTLFQTPYHTMLGLALKEPFTFFSWINWTSHFYGETDVRTGIVGELGSSDEVDVISAMLYREFSLGTKAFPEEPKAASFVYGGRVESVWDPENLLSGRIREGQRFSGKLSYDTLAPYKYPDPNESAPYGISVHFPSLDLTATGIRAAINNNFYDGWSQIVSDRFGLDAYAKEEASISWSLIDTSAQALANNNLLPDTLVPAQWQQNMMVITGYHPENRSRPAYRIVGIVDHVTRAQNIFEFEVGENEPELLLRPRHAPKKHPFTVIQPDYPVSDNQRLEPAARPKR